MISNFRLKLSILMILFALTISSTLAFTDQFRLKSHAVENERYQFQQNIEMLKYALETSEKASFLLGENIVNAMQDSTLRLIKAYESNPNLDEWDLHSWKELLSFDIYFINSDNTITHSTVPSDIGLNFTTCCKKLTPILDNRRAQGSFFHDGFDVEQYSGKIIKYSYMATPDKQYLIQLGASLQEAVTFQQFNFQNTIEQLVAENDSFNEINVLNIGGLPLGNVPDEHVMTDARREAFERTLSTGQSTTLTDIWDGQPAYYEYIIYSSIYDSGSTKQKVLEIIYNKDKLEAKLLDNRQTFITQLIVVFLVTILLSLMIAKWVAKPMHLAFHDSLTGLKNRAAFNESLQVVLHEEKGNTALLMIDLDNFKLVNDSLGHDHGDYLLRNVANVLRYCSRKADICFRLGGDEFIMMMPIASRAEAESTAQLIITSMDSITIHTGKIKIQPSVSIGIAIAPEHGTDQESLCKHADIALYQAKELGKNQYQVYLKPERSTRGFPLGQ
jgi:diguanylate cyclase (GGDEF)-like protein